MSPIIEQADENLPQRASPYFLAKDQIIKVAGANVRVREEGKLDGPPLILLHGFTFSLESFDGWVDVLAEDYRLIRYDLLGHGLTGPDAQKRYSPADRATFLGQIMDALGVERAAIAGNSLGGLIAWRFAAQYPERVDQLILVSPAAYSISGVSEVPAPIPPNMEYYLRHAPDLGVRTSLAFVYGDDRKITEDRFALAKSMLTHPGNGQAFIDHLKVFTLPNPNSELSRISAPTLIIWGAQDALVPVAQAPMLAAAIPDTQLQIYPEAGHVAQEEIPTKTATLAARFLNRNTP